MASDKKFVEYVVDQIKRVGTIKAKSMFGEYGVYADGKLFALICDNKLFIKPTEPGRTFIHDVIESPPYPGAKNCFLIEDKLDDWKWLSELVKITVKALPPTKVKMEKLLRYTGKDIQNIELNSWLEQKPAVLRPLAIKWFNVIQKCGSDVQSIFHDGYPMGCVDHAPFAYVNVFKAHMNVGFFYGAALTDRVGLLEGEGKRMRHIKIMPDLKYNEKEIKTLIEAAYVDIKQRLAVGY